MIDNQEITQSKLMNHTKNLMKRGLLKRMVMALKMPLINMVILNINTALIHTPSHMKVAMLDLIP